MEASVLSAAVTGVLKIVGNKLAPLVIKEYSSIVGVKKDLLELQYLVEEINCWMETEGDKAMGNAPSFNWLKKLKDVAYAVDDVVDEFQLEAEKHDTNDDGHFVQQSTPQHFVSKYLRKKTKSFMLQCKAAHKIKAIKKRFSIIVKQRTDLTAIVGHPVRRLNKTTVAMPTLPIVNEAAVLGRDQDKKNIITKLVKTNGQLETEIVSIIGLGGTGKTTLARLVFNDSETIKKHFEPRLWVHVSQEFNVTQLVEKLFEAITKDKSNHHTMQYMSETILKELTGKKFLLVLDDIWIEDRSQHGQFQEKFMVYLNSSSSRSKILLTTRSRRVAQTLESTELYDLPFLSLDDSFQLFHRSFGAGAKELNYEYQKVAKEIVGKCGGVPLAIKVLAGTLRDKELIGEWEAMRDNNLLDVEGEESVSACLKLSYFYLPSHLKQCFTICSLFPKGHQICKDQLIDQWIAHNMINLTIGVNYLEDIGHRYFNSLVQVSFLQDVDEYHGRVICKMHDLVHDLARSILCEEISTIVPEDATSSTKNYRYFSLMGQPRNLLPENVFESARAIYIDKGDDIIFGKALKNAKHLCSIIVNSIRLTQEFTTIFQEKNLKYLEISHLQCEALPEAISDIWSLQALYLTSSAHLEKLPKSIGKLKKLRTLNLSWCSKLRSLPDSIGDCYMLSTLDIIGCCAFEGLPYSIDSNKRLRVLRLVFTGICSLPSSITDLENLEYLKVKALGLENGEDRYSLVELPEGINKLTKLKILDLDYYVAMPPGIGQLTRLEKLNNFCLDLDKKYATLSELATLSRIRGKLGTHFLRCLTDPYDARNACLKEKENLHDLELSWGAQHRGVNDEHEVAVLDGLEPPSGLKRLKICNYGGGRFTWWMLKQVDVGVQGLCRFPFLTEMSLDGFPYMKHLDGLVQLPCLETLHLESLPALESISGGPFPSLVKLRMNRLWSLGEVWVVKNGALFGKDEGEGCNNHNPHQSGQLQIGSHFKIFDITDCPKLWVKPYFPISLEHLSLQRCNSNLLLSPCQWSSSSSSSPPSYSHLKVLKLWCMKGSLLLSPPLSPGLRSGCRWELLQHMSALESLEIFLCNDLTELPEYLVELCSLQKLTIKNCRSLCSLPQSIGHLTSLQELEIKDCDALVQLPQGLGELHSLCKLHIWCLPGLTCLPQSLCRLTTSLKVLGISFCPGITSLPEWIKGLTSLQQLEINGCPDLEKRCERGTGEDWHLISHIQHVQIRWVNYQGACY